MAGISIRSISEIMWSADSGRVGFLTNEAILGVYDTSTGSPVASGYLRYPNVNYPPKFVARAVAFSADGSFVTFQPCERTFGSEWDAEHRREQLVEHTECQDRRDTRAIADLAQQQARFHPGRAF